MPLSSRRSRPARAITQRDLAAYCGLHQTTVSLALRRDPRASADTIERVLAAADELGYDPSRHLAARRMVLGRYGLDVLSHVIAIFLPPNFHQDRYFLEPFTGVMDVVTPADFDLLTTNLGHFDASEHFRLSPSFARGDVDGVIVFTTPEELDRLCTHLRTQETFGARPIVSLIYSQAGCSTVQYDYGSGARAAAAHLLALGHRHLLHLVSPLGAEIRRQREDGIRQAFLEGHLDPGGLQTASVANDWIALDKPHTGLSLLNYLSSEDHVPCTLPEYLAAHPEITAILAWNDACAIHAWRLLLDAGRRVPAEISIIGFDDTRPFTGGDADDNLLTSVRLPLAEMGREAARLVIGRVTGQIPEDRLLLLPTELVVRASTGAVCSA